MTITTQQTKHKAQHNTPINNKTKLKIYNPITNQSSVKNIKQTKKMFVIISLHFVIL